MKKLITVLLLTAIFATALAVPSFAMTEKDILDAIEANVPDEYKATYLPQIENILGQIELTEEQCTELVALVEEKATDDIISDTQLGKLPVETKNEILNALDEAAEIADIDYTYAKTTQSQKDVYTVKVTTKPTAENPEPKVIAVVEGSQLVKKTGVAETAPLNFALPVAACILLAAAFVMLSRRRTSYSAA